MPGLVQEVPILHRKEDGIYLRNTQRSIHMHKGSCTLMGKFINLRHSGTQQAMAVKRWLLREGVLVTQALFPPAHLPMEKQEESLMNAKKCLPDKADQNFSEVWKCNPQRVPKEKVTNSTSSHPVSSELRIFRLWEAVEQKEFNNNSNQKSACSARFDLVF